MTALVRVLWCLSGQYIPCVYIHICKIRATFRHFQTTVHIVLMEYSEN